MTTDHINHTSIKLTRAVNALFSFTKDAYQSEFCDDRSQQREFCRRVAEKYAGLIGCKVVDAGEMVAAKPVSRPAARNPVVYGIGIECESGSFGMTHGPNPNLLNMLSVVPVSENAKIIKFTESSNGTVISDVMFDWDGSEWRNRDGGKSGMRISTANPLATKAIELAEQIIELADSPDLPPAAIDYAESVTGKARSIAGRVESENMATSGQITALENMLDGLQRWFQYVD